MTRRVCIPLIDAIRLIRTLVYYPYPLIQTYVASSMLLSILQQNGWKMPDDLLNALYQAPDSDYNNAIEILDKLIIDLGETNG